MPATILQVGNDNPRLAQANLDQAKTHAFWLAQHLNQGKLSIEDFNYVELLRTNVIEYMRLCNLSELRVAADLTLYRNACDQLFFQTEGYKQAISNN